MYLQDYVNNVDTKDHRSHCFLLPLLLQAQSTFYPFLSYTSYRGGSFKDADMAAGIYANISHDTHIFKLGLECKDTAHKENNSSSFDNFQTNLIAGYTTEIADKIFLDATAHLILSDLYQADTNQIYLIGLSYKKLASFLFGLDTAYALYNAYSLVDNVTQISPYFGFWYGKTNSLMGHIFTKVTYNYTKPSGANVVLSKTYNNGELFIQQFTTHFINSLAFSFGKNINLVKDKGFSVYNANEIHDRGLTVSSEYKINPDTNIKLSYVYEEIATEYDPLLGDSLENAKMYRFVLSGTLRF